MSLTGFFKKQCIFILLLIFLFASCSKDKDPQSLQAQLPFAPDLIYFDSLLIHQPEEALAYAHLSLERSRESKKEDLELKALMMQSKALLQLNENEEALKKLKMLLSKPLIGKEVSLIAEAYKNLGIAEVRLENYLSAIIYFRKTLNLNEQVDIPNIFADAAEGLGDIFAAMRYFNNSLKYYRKAQDYRIQDKDKQGYNKLFIKTGGIYSEEEKYDAALKEYEKALAYFNGPGTRGQQAIVLRKISKIHLLKENLDSAGHAAMQAKEWAVESADLETLSGSYQVIAQVNAALANYQEANLNWQAALELADILNDEVAMAEIYRELAEVNEKLGRHKQAVAYFKSYTKSSEKALKEQKQQKSKDILNAIKLNKSEKEIASLKKRNEVVEKYSSIRSQGLGDNRSFIILLTAFVVVFILLVAVYYKRFKDKKNASAVLEEMVKKRTSELHRALQKLFFHINNTSLAVIELNPDLQITGWTGQSEKIFGWKPHEVLERQFFDIALFDKEALVVIKSIFKKIKSGRLSKKFILTKSQHKEHTALFIEWNFSVLYDEAGKTTSISCFANDVTHREKALLEAETANKELDNFIYKTSHDVKGPISRIEGLINLGIMETQEEVSKQYFTMLQQVAADFNIVLSRLFRIHGIYYHKPVAVSLNLKQEINALIKKLQKKNALYELKYEIDIPYDAQWRVDKLLFYIIIQNIYENALDYRRDNFSKIIFSAEILNPNCLKLSIRDNGTCIPLHAADRIFDMFFQNTAQSNTAGLGMYMVKKSVEKLGGTIKLLEESEETFFEILLPA